MLNCSNPSFLLSDSPILTPKKPTVLRTKFSLPMLTLFCKLTWHNRLTLLHSQTFTVLTRSPYAKANPPFAHCIIPTKQMAT